MRKSLLIFAIALLVMPGAAVEPKPTANPASKSVAAAPAKPAPIAEPAPLRPAPEPEPGLYEIPGPVTPAGEIDRIVLARLTKLGIAPALCSDAVFLRRVYLDVIGTLPTLEEARAFLDDPDAGNKRSRLIDELLERDEFAVYWSMKWGDILRIKAEFPVNLWPNAAQAYDRWVKESIATNKPYDQFARELLTSSGSNFRVGPVNFYRAIQDKTPGGIAAAVVLTLMGSRADFWPEGQLDGMSPFFSEVGYKSSREWKEELIFWDPHNAVGWAGYVAAQEEYERLKADADAKAATAQARRDSVKKTAGALARAKAEPGETEAAAKAAAEALAKAEAALKNAQTEGSKNPGADRASAARMKLEAARKAENTARKAASTAKWSAPKKIESLTGSLKSAKAALAKAEEDEKASAEALTVAQAAVEKVKVVPESAKAPKQAKTAVLPDGTRVTLPLDRDPRTVFADWLITPENPWFTRNITNRLWSWLLGRGIIHEPDDIRDDNPPSNPELLAYLEKEMIAGKYDLKRMYRMILNSKAYQFSSIPKSKKPEAEANFASYLPRRLPAEVLIDNVNSITGTTDLYTSAIPEPFTYIPKDMPAIGVADGSITSSFLSLFGRSARATGMETERIDAPQASQMLHMLNSSHIREKIERGPKLVALLRSRKPTPEIAQDLYLTILSRYPNAEEVKRIEAYGAGNTTKSSTEWIDIAWALINSTEALYRH